MWWSQQSSSETNLDLVYQHTGDEKSHTLCDDMCVVTKCIFPLQSEANVNISNSLWNFVPLGSTEYCKSGHKQTSRDNVEVIKNELLTPSYNHLRLIALFHLFLPVKVKEDLLLWLKF